MQYQEPPNQEYQNISEPDSQVGEGALTDVAHLFGDVSPDVGDVPHGHEGVEAGALLRLLDVGLVGETVVVGMAARNISTQMIKS